MVRSNRTRVCDVRPENVLGGLGDSDLSDAPKSVNIQFCLTAFKFSPTLADCVLVRPMRRYFLTLLLLLLATSPALSKRYTDAERDAMFIVRPVPDYPYELREHRIEGSGLYRMYVDSEGKVTAVKILQSAGHPGLDNAALRAFKRWRAKPGPPGEVDMPATFTLHYRR